MGILFAITALVAWGLGDFLIQRSARAFGDWIALFYITAFGSIILFPFVYGDLRAAFGLHSLLLFTAGFVILFAALLDFEALRIGKISIIEPIYALEIPVAAILAATLIHENLTLPQVFFIIVIMTGIFLVSIQSFKNFGTAKLERGVWYAIFATIGMGTANFLFGLGARATSPLVINWFSNTFIAIVALGYLAATTQLGAIVLNFKEKKRLILNVSFFDKLAWISFSYAMLYIPIAVATGISEGYIAFAAGLGLTFNHEHLRPHQKVGFVLAIAAVIVLALVTDK